MFDIWCLPILAWFLSEEALTGIAKLAFLCRIAQLEGWTNHFSVINHREEDLKSYVMLYRLGLQVASISAHSDLSTPEEFLI